MRANTDLSFQKEFLILENKAQIHPSKSSQALSSLRYHPEETGVQYICTKRNRRSHPLGCNSENNQCRVDFQLSKTDMMQTRAIWRQRDGFSAVRVPVISPSEQGNVQMGICRCLQTTQGCTQLCRVCYKHPIPFAREQLRGQGASRE